MLLIHIIPYHNDFYGVLNNRVFVGNLPVMRHFFQIFAIVWVLFHLSSVDVIEVFDGDDFNR